MIGELMDTRCTLASIAFCTILISVAPNRASAIKAYVPLNGLVAIEAEDLQPGTLWEKQTTPNFARIHLDCALPGAGPLESLTVTNPCNLPGISTGTRCAAECEESSQESSA
jgi:hypothetical protein